jgi:hypothetical protein
MLAMTDELLPPAQTLVGPTRRLTRSHVHLISRSGSGIMPPWSG